MARRKPLRECFESKIEPCPTTGCWLWTGSLYGWGHGSLRNGAKLEGAHRVAWQLYRGPIPDGKLVLHMCDVPSCVNPAHLYIGTWADNVRDCLERKRHKGYLAGEKHWKAKLTREDVNRIRSDTRSQAAIGRDYGVSQEQISRIKRMEQWT